MHATVKAQDNLKRAAAWRRLRRAVFFLLTLAFSVTTLGHGDGHAHGAGEHAAVLAHQVDAGHSHGDCAERHAPNLCCVSAACLLCVPVPVASALSQRLVGAYRMADAANAAGLRARPPERPPRRS